MCSNGYELPSHLNYECVRKAFRGHMTTLFSGFVNPSRIDLMSFRPMGGLCSTVLAPLAHCSVFSLDFWRSLDFCLKENNENIKRITSHGNWIWLWGWRITCCTPFNKILNISFEEMMPESTPDQTILDPPALFIKQGIMQPFGFDIGNFHCICWIHPTTQDPSHHQDC